MLVRYRALGDVPTAATDSYVAWTERVKSLLIDRYGDDWRIHGGPVVMPSNVPPTMQRYVGQPAAMFDNDTYVALGNAGYIDINRPQVASNSGKVVFVLAPPDAIAAAPKTMTAAQRIANTVFTAGDITADAIGLPSLDAIEGAIKGIGREVLIGIGVTIGVALVLKSMRKH